jgi:hypothetical protein
MFPHLKKSESSDPIILSTRQEIKMLKEKLNIAINALSEYSDAANWSKVNCWGTIRERRWRGQSTEQEGFDLARKTLEKIGIKASEKSNKSKSK